MDISQPIDLNLKGGLTLNELLEELEDVHNSDLPSNIEIILIPPENEVVTDEDSGDEDNLLINNLPRSQINTIAELNYDTNQQDTENEDPEDNIPLSEIRRKLKKTVVSKRKYVWSDGEINSQNVNSPFINSASNQNTPLELFNLFFDDGVLEHLVIHTNLYLSRKNKKSDIKIDEFQRFIGILLLSGYMSVPRRRMYWENAENTHHQLVSAAMSRDRFELIFSNFHCCDNENLDLSDRFAKVRPMINMLNKKFQEHAPHVQNHSVDESMIPYYGRHPTKQFIRGKPIRYGYKFWIGCTNKGYVIWMEPYQGAQSIIKEEYRTFGLGPSVILEYADVLLSLGKYPYHLFFDNFFTTIPLLCRLLEIGISGTGTVRENRLHKCPIMSKDLMKKECRGFFKYKVTEKNTIITLRWNDNNIVNIASNLLSAYPLKKVSRYDKKNKKRIPVDQPNIVAIYNSNMGGVDRMDENISLYRICIRGKKWYMPILNYLLDLSVQNAWQLHRRQDGKLDQVSFRRRIVLSLLQSHNRTFGKRSRPSNLENAGRRYDRMDHFITNQENRTRCRICYKKVPTKCSKCDVALHINCFIQYHTE